MPKLNSPRKSGESFQVRREIRLPEDFAHLSPSYRHVPKPPPAIRPFDLADCLDRFVRFQSLPEKKWEQREKVLNIRPGLSLEEARFWYEIFTSRTLQRLEPEFLLEHLNDALEKPREGLTIKIPNLSGRHQVQFGIVLWSLFSTQGLAQTLVPACFSWHIELGFTHAVEIGFARAILPFSSDDALSEMRQIVAHVMATFPFPKNPDSIPAFCFRLATILGMTDELLPIVEHWPDNAFSGERGRLAEIWLRPQSFVLALREPQLVEHHFRRLNLPGCPIGNWIAITGFSALDVVEHSIIWELSKSVSKSSISALGQCAISPEVAPVMLNLMLESQTPEPAQKWLETHPVETIAGLVPVALGTGMLADAAIAMLEVVNLRNPVCELSREVLSLSEGEIERLANLMQSPSESRPILLNEQSTPEWLHKVMSDCPRYRRNPPWLVVRNLSALVWEQYRLSFKQTDRLLWFLQFSTRQNALTFFKNPVISSVKERCSPESRNRFVLELLGSWKKAGSPPKDEWAFLCLGLIGDDAGVDTLASEIRNLENRDSPLAVICVELLCLIGTENAMKHLIEISVQSKIGPVSKSAEECLSRLAVQFKLSPEAFKERFQKKRNAKIPNGK